MAAQFIFDPLICVEEGYIKGGSEHVDRNQNKEGVPSIIEIQERVLLPSSLPPEGVQEYSVN